MEYHINLQGKFDPENNFTPPGGSEVGGVEGRHGIFSDTVVQLTLYLTFGKKMEYFYLRPKFIKIEGTFSNVANGTASSCPAAACSPATSPSLPTYCHASERPNRPEAIAVAAATAH